MAAARAAYLGGFASTSNLEAGRRYGVPTAGTVAHAFVLSFGDERAAFAAQVAAFGPDTTFLVDTYDMEEGIRRAVAAAGPGWRRSGSTPATWAPWPAGPGSSSTSWAPSRPRIDRDRRSRRPGHPGARARPRSTATASAPAWSPGLGSPTAGLIYKLVAVGGRPVAKRSPGKATVGGRKWAWRVPGRAEEVVGHRRPGPRPRGPAAAVAGRCPGGERRRRGPDLDESRAWHRQVLAELPPGEALDAGASLT